VSPSVVCMGIHPDKHIWGQVLFYNKVPDPNVLLVLIRANDVGDDGFFPPFLCRNKERVSMQLKVAKSTTEWPQCNRIIQKLKRSGIDAIESCKS
jgi:hypothetical protein